MYAHTQYYLYDLLAFLNIYLIIYTYTWMCLKLIHSYLLLGFHNISSLSLVKNTTSISSKIKGLGLCLPWMGTWCPVSYLIKEIVHLNIIFSYIKFNKICNLNHPVYKLIYAGFLLHVYCVFCIITYMGDSILKKTFSICPPERLCVQYYNMSSFPVWLQI